MTMHCTIDCDFKIYGQYRRESGKWTWNGQSTKRLNNGIKHKAMIFIAIACYFFVLHLISSCIYLSFQVLVIRVLLLIPQFQHTHFPSYTSLYIIACKYLFTNVDILHHLTTVNTYWVSLYLPILSVCIFLFWVYLHSLILHFIASLNFSVPWYNIYTAIDRFYTLLSILRYFIEQCNNVLRADLYNIRNLNLHLLTIVCLDVSIPTQLGTAVHLCRLFSDIMILNIYCGPIVSR